MVAKDETINQVRLGKIDPKVANAVGYLASVHLKALEQGPVQERLARIEASLRIEGNTEPATTQKEVVADAHSNHTQAN
jgi:hypothetical protein